MRKEKETHGHKRTRIKCTKTFNDSLYQIYCQLPSTSVPSSHKKLAIKNKKNWKEKRVISPEEEQHITFLWNRNWEGTEIYVSNWAYLHVQNTSF